MKAFFLLALSAAASMLVIPLAWRLAPRIGMLDQPDPRKVHTVPVPRVGGWGIAAGCVVPLLLLGYTESLPLAFVAGVLVLFAFGAWDDAREIGHWPKFAGQIIAVALVVFWGDLYVTRLPFVDELDPLVGRLFTMVALVGVINAINHSDGLDGLAAGESLLSLVAMAFLGHLAGATLVADLALVVIGGIIGFLRYNTHPARVFMGDAGSQVLGFAAGFLVVYLVQEANSAVSAALPLLLLGLPIADINAVLIQRIRGRMNWFKATRNHVHHRLLDLGFTHSQSVVAIYTFQALLVTSAVPLRYADDLVVLGLYAAAITMLFVLLARAERRGWRMGRGSWPLLQFVSAHGANLRRSPRLQATATATITMAVGALMMLAVLRSEEVPRDFGVTAAAAVVLVVLVHLWRRDWRGATIRVAAYVTVAFTTYLLAVHPAGPDAMLRGFGIAIAVLAVLLGLFVSLLADRDFTATPTDYLVAFAVLALLAFSAPQTGNLMEGPLRFIVPAVVLFYACEVVIGHLRRWQLALGGASLATLLLIALRGLATGF